VLVGERVIDSVNERNGSQNLIGHLVHGVLDTCAVVLGECAHGDGSDLIPCIVELRNIGANLVYRSKGLPVPSAFHFSAENAIPNLWQLGILIAVEAVKCRACAFQNEKLIDARLDGDAFAFSCDELDFSCLVAIAVERVCMWLSVNCHTGPSLLDDLDVGGVDMRVGLDEVVANDRGKEFDRCDWVLFCEDVACLLLCVCRDNNGVVGFGVPIWRY
jgi:hypothetical protein